MTVGSVGMASAAVVKGSAGGGAKVRPGPPKEDGGSKGKVAVVLPQVKKKVEESVKPAASSKLKSVTVMSKPEVKGKIVTKTVTKTESSKSTSVKVKAEKKVYTLAGQKHDPPEEREPLRIFYESLSKQIPSSEMAEFWMMEHGLLSHERAKRAYEKKQKKQHQLRTGTPIKSPKLERPESSKKPQISKNGDPKAKKRVKYSDDDDDDFIVKHKKTKG